MTLRELGWLTPLVLLATLAMAVAWMFGPDVLEFMMVSWPISVAAMALLALAIWRTRRWLLLLCLPILAWPLILWTLLLYECARGNCL